MTIPPPARTVARYETTSRAPTRAEGGRSDGPGSGSADNCGVVGIGERTDVEPSPNAGLPVE